MPKSKNDYKSSKTTKQNLRLTSERESIISKLERRKWYKNTDPSVKKELLSLTEDFNGFLTDLANRPETIGNVDVLSLVKIPHGNYHALPVFEVRSNLTNEKFTYEYFSWKYGRYPGYRGIILIEVNHQIRYFIIKRGQKFAIANQAYDAIGTVVNSYTGDKLTNLPASINNQLKKMLNINELKFERYIDLGLFNTDPAASNNHTALFAAVINFTDAERIKKHIEGKQFRTLAPGFELEIHPIERLSEYVVKSDDSFFLATVARLFALNILTDPSHYLSSINLK